MRVLGVDPSGGWCGLAMVEIGSRGGVRFVDVESFDAKSFLKDKDDEDGRARSMYTFKIRLRQMAHGSWPALIAITRAHSPNNVRTIRQIAYYEAVVMLVAAEIRSKVVMMADSTARRLVLPPGWGRSKGDVYEPFMELYGSKQDWPERGAKGTDDVIDAAVAAIACPKRLRELNG